MSDFLCVDLGASSTRYCGPNGQIKWMSNPVCILSEGTNTLLEPWAHENPEEEVKQSLDVTITRLSEPGTPLEEKDQYFPVRALVGEITARHSAASERPSAIQNKHKQRINYINALTVLAVECLIGGLDSSDVHMFIALPPIEAKPATAYVRNQLIGGFEVKFNMLNKKINIRISDVQCLEESYMALASFFFNPNGSKNMDHAKYETGNVLSLDIGASTTDFAITQNRKYLEKTGRTFKLGGNVVRDLVASKIQLEYGYEPDEQTAERVVAEGRIQAGSSFKDFSKQVQEAKQEFASQIVTNMQGYFRIINIPLQSIDAIVVSGGGSMASSFAGDDGMITKTSEAMSYYITEKLKTLCDTLDVLPVGDSPRTANIMGMYVRACFDKVRRDKAAQARVSTAGLQTNTTFHGGTPDGVQNRLAEAYNGAQNTSIQESAVTQQVGYGQPAQENAGLGIQDPISSGMVAEPAYGNQNYSGDTGMSGGNPAFGGTQNL